MDRTYPSYWRQNLAAPRQQRPTAPITAGNSSKAPHFASHFFVASHSTQAEPGKVQRQGLVLLMKAAHRSLIPWQATAVADSCATGLAYRVVGSFWSSETV